MHLVSMKGIICHQKKKKKEKKTEKSMKMLDHCHMISENSEVDIYF